MDSIPYLAVDTETTGLDLNHGAKPYFVTTYDGENNEFWQWDVDPSNRKPIIPRGHKRQIRNLLARSNKLILQNARFDYAALRTIGISLGKWDRIEDTLLAGHLLYSNEKHDLTSMAAQYLETNIQHLEDSLEICVKEAQRYCRSNLPHWRLAKAGAIDMPSAKEKTWKFDTWLPRTLARYLRLPKGHPWFTAAEYYANADSTSTYWLLFAQQKKIKERKLEKIYEVRKKLLPVIDSMETRGVTVSEETMNNLVKEYTQESKDLGKKCVDIAKKHKFLLSLPKSGNSKALTEFVFQVLKLPVLERTEKGSPSLNKRAFDRYLVELESLDGTWQEALEFMRSLSEKRSRDTALAYLAGYRKFWLPVSGLPGWYKLFSRYNPTGTHTLRFSSSNPNAQNYSRKDGFNLRKSLGPAPGRKWISMDYENIELRIPAYDSGQQEMIDLFERPNDPPYYGSQHLLVAHILHPQMFDECIAKGVSFKDKEDVGGYKTTWYQWVKNGNFACVPMETEALTRNGWKTYSEIQEGDEVLGCNGEALEWTKVEKKCLFQEAPLMKIENNHFSAVVTPDHRWLGHKRVGGTDTRRNKRMLFNTKCISSEHTIYLSKPTIDKCSLNITDEEAAIIGFAYADGSVIKSEKSYGNSRGKSGRKVGFQVKLFQKKKEGIRYLNNLLSKWGGIVRKCKRSDSIKVWTLSPWQARDIWKRAGLWDKQDFEQFVLNLGPSQRKAYLDAIYVAEGCLDGRGNTRVIAQNEGPFAESIKLVMFLCGNFPTYSKKINYYGSEHTCLDIRESKPYVTGQRITKTKLEGKHEVWCLKTELGTWVMRQHGQIMLTGNCQYGAQESSGTADRAFHKVGAQRMIQERFYKIKELNDQMIAIARRRRYVETMPDKTIDPLRGYPLLCTRTDRGSVLPTVPLSYRVQGTAMWCTMKAMLRCHEQLESWRRNDGYEGYIVLQVHDEMVFDLPVVKEGSDYWRIRKLKELMEQSGDDIGVPLRVSVSYHPVSWADDVAINLSL